MSFIYAPTCLRFPAIPNFELRGGIWRGVDDDDGLVAYETGSSRFGYYIMTEGLFCYRLDISGSAFNPVFTDINGYVYWKGSGYFYHTLTYGWVLCSQFPGYEPLETYDYESREYSGDSFYVASSLPHSEDSTISLTPRGRIRNEGPKTLKIVFPRWVSKNSGELGEYEGTGGCEGSKVLGLPRWRADNWEYHVRSLEKDKTGHFTYGAVHYANGKWLIGDEDSESGWHEGSEPNKDGSSVFTFCKPEDSEITGKNITLTFRDYVVGEDSEKGLVGEVALWR